MHKSQVPLGRYCFFSLFVCLLNLFDCLLVTLLTCLNACRSLPLSLSLSLPPSPSPLPSLLPFPLALFLLLLHLLSFRPLSPPLPLHVLLPTPPLLITTIISPLSLPLFINTILSPPPPPLLPLSPPLPLPLSFLQFSLIPAFRNGPVRSYLLVKVTKIVGNFLWI